MEGGMEEEIKEQKDATKSASIKRMTAVTSIAQKLLRAGASMGSEVFLCILYRLGLESEQGLGRSN
jgi:hypothetical protein